MPPQNEQGAQQRPRSLKFLAPLLEYGLQQLMDRRQRRQQGRNTPPSSGATAQNTFETPPSQRRRRKGQSDETRTPPSWTEHHSTYPHHYVRDYAAYRIPRALGNIAQSRPLAKPKRKSMLIHGYKDFIADYTKYEIDRQLRKGLPDLDSERRYPKPSERVGVSLRRAAKFFDYAEEMIRHEIEKEIRKFVRRHIEEHGEPPAFPTPTSQVVDEDQYAAGALRPETPVTPPNQMTPGVDTTPTLRWAELDIAQREFLSAALSKRLGRLIAENAGDILIRVDQENGTLWGIGHDDLIQRTVNREFDLEGVRQDPGPQRYNDKSGNNTPAGQNHFGTPASTYGPFGLRGKSETPKSTSTAQTRWPTPRQLARQWGEETASPPKTKMSAPKTAPPEKRKPKPEPKKKPAEPSFGTIIRSLSLQSNKARSRPSKKPALDLPMIEDPSMMQRVHAEAQAQNAMPLQRGDSMKRPHHISLSEALRRSKEKQKRSSSASPSKQKSSTSRGTKISSSFRGRARSKPKSNDNKEKAPAVATATPEDPETPSSDGISNLPDPKPRKHPYRQTGSDEDRPSYESLRVPEQQPPAVVPVASSGSIGRPIPRNRGLGISYDELREGTPPVFQDPAHPSTTLPRGQILPTRPARPVVDPAAAAAQVRQIPILSPVTEIASPVRLAHSPAGSTPEAPPPQNPARSRGGGTAASSMGPRVSAAHDALQKAMGTQSAPSSSAPASRRAPANNLHAPNPRTAPTINLPDPFTDDSAAEASVPRRPSAGRLADLASQNPASALAPPKQAIGSRLLDKLDAERKARVASTAPQNPFLRPSGPGRSASDETAGPHQTLEGKTYNPAAPRSKSVSLANHPINSPRAPVTRESQVHDPNNLLGPAPPSLRPRTLKTPSPLSSNNSPSVYSPSPAQKPAPLFFTGKSKTKRTTSVKDVARRLREAHKEESPGAKSPAMGPDSSFTAILRDADARDPAYTSSESDDGGRKWSWPPGTLGGVKGKEEEGGKKDKSGKKEDNGKKGPFGGAGGGWSFGGV